MKRQLGRIALAWVIAFAVTTSAGCSIIRHSTIRTCDSKPMIVDLSLAGASLVPLTVGAATSRYRVAFGSLGALVLFLTSSLIGLHKAKRIAPPGYRVVCTKRAPN